MIIVEKGNNLKIEVITGFEDFLSLERVWNNLLEQSQNDVVFLRHEWFKSWWIGFGKDKELFILVVKDEKEIIGLAPLMIASSRYRGMWVKQISFMENDNTPQTDFILTERKKEAVGLIIECLQAHREKWDVIYLRNIPKVSENNEILSNILKQNKMLFRWKDGLCSPFVQMDSDWKTYFQSRSAKFRKVLRNKINRLQRLGAYTIQQFERIENNGKPLAGILEISRNSWKAKFQKDIATNRENKTFFEELSRIAADKGWLKIWLLTLGHKPLAYEYHLLYQNREYALRADFDEKYRQNHPGSVLDAHIMQNIFENNLKEYDLGGSNDLYKINWTSQVKNHSNFLIFNQNFKGVSLYILEFKLIVFIKKLINPVRRSYKTAYQIYKSQGVLRLGERLIKKIIHFVFITNSAIWFERDLLDIAELEAKIPVEINMACGSETIEWLKNREETWLFNPREIEVGLKNNHYFPTVRYKGNIIGCAKVGMSRVYIADFERIINFPADMIFIYDTFVLPEYRGRGIAPYLISEIMKFAAAKGFRRIRCHIPDWNKASINAYTKIGFKKIKNIRCMRIMGSSILTSNPVGY